MRNKECCSEAKIPPSHGDAAGRNKELGIRNLELGIRNLEFGISQRSCDPAIMQ